MSTYNTESVSIPHPEKREHSFRGYLVKPTPMPAPGVLVLHEAFGLNENIHSIANRFAAAGYVALAADLFSDGNKMICMVRAFYGLLVAPLNNGTAKNVRAAFEFLRHVRGVDSARVGVIGFCLGGSYALQLACLDGEVSAISVVSGQNPKPLEALKRACPIVGSYPEKDFTTAGARKLDVVLDEYSIPHDIKIYENGIHSMWNDGAKGYSSEIAEDAWNRTLSFFEQHFRDDDVSV